MDGENAFSPSILAVYFFGGASTQQQSEFIKHFRFYFSRFSNANSAAPSAPTISGSSLI